MSLRLSKWTAVLVLSLVLLGIMGSTALAYYGPWYYSAIVPKFGGIWWGDLLRASGPNEKNYTSSVGGSYNGDMWGYVADMSGRRLTPSQPLYKGQWTYYYSGAHTGLLIRYIIKSEWWVPVNVQVTGSFYY
ncbi:MAG: hypothetical protein PWQ91_149 [Eubacteriales bacterium]|nr:hypothetical protein [Eubacteriales bacterium]